MKLAAFKPLIVETYQGVVMHADEKSVTVIYNCEGEYLEHNYNKEQFISEELPKVGDKVIIRVILFKKE